MFKRIYNPVMFCFLINFEKYYWSYVYIRSITIRPEIKNDHEDPGFTCFESISAVKASDCVDLFLVRYNGHSTST